MDKSVKFVWSAEVAKVPFGLYNLQGPSATLIGSTVYIFGGGRHKRVTFLETIYILHLATKTYSELRLPEAVLLTRQRFNSFYAQDCIYLYGGELGDATDDVPTPHLLKFDILNLEVEKCFTVGEEPEPSKGVSGDYIESLDSFVLFGGRKDGSIYSNRVHRLQGKRRWREDKPPGEPPRPRFGHTTCCVERSEGWAQIFVFGGVATRGLERMFFIDLHLLEYYAGAPRWSQVQVNGGPPMARRRSTLSHYGSRLFLIGGTGATEKMPEIDVFDLDAKKWFGFGASRATGRKFLLEGGFVPRADHATVQLNDGVLVLGGSGEMRRSRGLWSLKPQ